MEASLPDVARIDPDPTIGGAGAESSMSTDQSDGVPASEDTTMVENPANVDPTTTKTPELQEKDETDSAVNSAGPDTATTIESSVEPKGKKRSANTSKVIDGATDSSTTKKAKVGDTSKAKAAKAATVEEDSSIISFKDLNEEEKEKIRGEHS